MPWNTSENLCTLSSLSSKFSDLKVIAGGGSSIVYSGVDRAARSGTDRKVALKMLCLSGKGHCRVALRELGFLKRFQHENIVRTLKVVDQNGLGINSFVENCRPQEFCSVFVVEELMDSDLHTVLENCGKLSLNTSKLLAYQLLRGLKYIHSANVMHRDIKPGNLFIRGSDLTLKIGDFGLARVFDRRYSHRGYLTAVVSTMYYRAPEVMLDFGNYAFPVDVWSAGCVLGEMLLGKILFCGENDLDQLAVIASAFGLTVNDLKHGKDGNFPVFSFSELGCPEAMDLLEKMLKLDPAKRITVDEALRHSFFSDLHDPSDEPVCPQPFFIEHEVDDLPVKVLKKKILRSSCAEEVRKAACPKAVEGLFQDFDETFSADLKNPYCRLNSHGEELSDFSDASFSSLSKSYICCSSDEHVRNDCVAGNLPSVQEILAEADSSDLPRLDPGRSCDRVDYECSVALALPNQNTPSSIFERGQAYFSNAFPIDVTGDNFLRQARTFMKIHGPTESEVAKADWTQLVKTDLKSMSEEILKRLTRKVPTSSVCLADLTNSKHYLSQLRGQYPLVHLEPLRFWI